MEQTSEGQRLKLRPVVDEFTRECPTIEVERSTTGQDVISALEYHFRVHGEPEYIRSHSGAEFIAHVIKDDWPMQG